MEVRVYQIDKSSLQKVKAVLERKDTFDIEICCKGCGKNEKKTIDANSYKDYFDEKRVLKCACGGVMSAKITGKFMNEFVINGYILRDGGALGVNKEMTYLYINGEQDFFDGHEKEILEAGAKKVSGSDYDKVKGEIDKEQEAAAEGLGGIFNI
jgi:hypothetical protein